MGFVELNRFFVPVGKGEEPNLSLGSNWGPKYGGWLSWDALLGYRRVVLLAEAGSGKTSELRYRADALRTKGEAAFFVRIEDLADDGLEGAFDPRHIESFQKWLGFGEVRQGWFFLDSVDEARLNNKSLERALRKLTLALGSEASQRARVYVSCRVSDWKGAADYQLVERFLPLYARAEPEPTESRDPDQALLAPILDSDHVPKTRRTIQKPAADPDKLLVVQLTPLDNCQRRALAVRAGADGPDELILEINRQGLDRLAERPADLLGLVAYWVENNSFAALEEMTEYCIARKLSELDAHRPDCGLISDEEARHGAERIAAALTLGKSFTLHAPSHGPDPGFAAGALRPEEILKEWTPSERNALLRRGVFAPSTYGRIRFHVRETQEYLTASWLRRLLQIGCPLEAVKKLIFVSRYGVDTVVPTLQATAAWLALRHSDIRDEIIRREPLLLLRHGDPGSLSRTAKEQIILSFARKHAAGQIADDGLDRRSLSLIAEPGLAKAIREAWRINRRAEFRLDMLRIVREGRIAECADLARKVALGCGNDESLRITALEALKECKDCGGLAAASAWISQPGATYGARLAASFATLMFPGHMDVESLSKVMERSPEVDRYSTMGFKYVLDQLWEACPDASTRERFIAGLCDLLLSPPFYSDHGRISARHSGLAEQVHGICRKALGATTDGEREVSEGLIRLLMVVERAERANGDVGEDPTLSSLVSSRPGLKRHLFWRDIDEVKTNKGHLATSLTRHWQVYLPRRLWKFDFNDLGWLMEDLSRRRLTEDRQVALSAAIGILRDADVIDVYRARLSEFVAGQDELERDLEAYLSPPKNNSSEAEEIRAKSERKKRLEAEKEKNKTAWISFRAKINEDAGVLHDRDLLSRNEGELWHLYYLTEWLSRKSQTTLGEAPRQWRLLEEGFGQRIPEAYFEGMKNLWRIVRPERPERNGSQISVKYMTILAYAALELEAAEDIDWPSKLNQQEIAVAAQHAAMSEQGFPQWLDHLLVEHPDTVTPILEKALQFEWTGRCGSYPTLLSLCTQRQHAIPSPLQEILFRLITGRRRPGIPEITDRMVAVVRRLDLDSDQKFKLKRVAARWFRAACLKQDIRRLHCYLAIHFCVDFETAVDALEAWLKALTVAERTGQAQSVLSVLFNRSSGSLASETLRRASVKDLVRLLRLAYRYIRPENDRVHNGPFEPNARDRAEEARGAILTALINKPGFDAYLAIRDLSSEPIFKTRATRLKEIACGKALLDADLPAWTPREVRSFEQQYIAPIKTPDSLMDAVMNVLMEIQTAMFNEDASSRPVIQRAKDESEVQKWLSEQLKLRARGRFHVHREAEVAGGDKPDILISSAAAPIEIAVEVKHGEKRYWTVKKLERALTDQLGTKYLKPCCRRHGLLLISRHGNRNWQSPETRELVEFSDLVSRLKKLASSTIRNAHGDYVSLKVFGLDLARREPPRVR